MNDLVSIVLPVYNGERYLRESIDSIISQTYKNWELLIIDDGSSDSTPEIGRFYEKKDRRIHYYTNEQNMRLPRSLNRGFSLTKGNYLTWTSDDNRYKPKAIEKMLNALKSHHADFVFASCRVIDEEGNNIEYMMTSNSHLKELMGHNIVGACFMYTRRVYRQVGEYDPEFALVEDFDYWQRIYSRYGAYVLEEILYEYRWHDRTLTSTKSEKDFYSILEKMLLKNRPLFKSPGCEERYYYYQALNSCRVSMGTKKNPYRIRYAVYGMIHLITVRIPGKVRRIKAKLWLK